MLHIAPVLMYAGIDFFVDPGGVALEFKAFADMVRLFEKGVLVDLRAPGLISDTVRFPYG